nr:hypothetical protein Iba_chr04dCG2700 [Ipomoea batatas]
MLPELTSAKPTPRRASRTPARSEVVTVAAAHPKSHFRRRGPRRPSPSSVLRSPISASNSRLEKYCFQDGNNSVEEDYYDDDDELRHYYDPPASDDAANSLHKEEEAADAIAAQLR